MIHPEFSLIYGNRSVFSRDLTAGETVDLTSKRPGEVLQLTRYALDETLEIEVTHRHIETYGADYWFLTLSNPSQRPSGIIKDLSDCDVRLELPCQDEPSRPGYQPDARTPRVFKTLGSNNCRDEFTARAEALNRESCLLFHNEGGRSSQGLAPFFNVESDDIGYLCAIGWSGQWQARFCREGDSLRLQSGLQYTHFRLLPGERYRTSSILIMPYYAPHLEAHNHFRRIIRDHFSLIGQSGRSDHGDLCVSGWGGMSTQKMLERIDQLTQHDLGFECYWVDAGWYGQSTGPCPNEFSGDWHRHTGDWRVNPTYHPDGLKDVAARLQEKGMRFMLWIEPERVIKTTPQPTAHPEWFFKGDGTGDNWLLNLGNEEARAETLRMVSEKIETLGLSTYRQDFNIDPLPFWQAADAPDRVGVSEMGHINGLYAFWDALLEKFPHLMIDNCASGGRRIDIETLSRSMPMWRSDYQCVFNCDPETTQMHNTAFSQYLPYTGTGMGCVMGDTYRARSCYASSLVVGFWAYDEMPFSEDQPLDWVRRMTQEYKRVRPFFSEDFYALVPQSLADAGWAAWQYNRPDKGDGILIALRRWDSPFVTADLFLQGLDMDGSYCFTDADNGEQFILTGAQLKEGLKFSIYERRASRLLEYRRL